MTWEEEFRKLVRVEDSTIHIPTAVDFIDSLLKKQMEKHKEMAHIIASFLIPYFANSLKCILKLMSFSSPYI